MSLFIIAEVVDLMRERIEHFKKLDFYNAMRVCVSLRAKSLISIYSGKTAGYIFSTN
jgi:CRISPR/Cas system-associated protein Cas10 (large subunit of type III CRISPR-Cas system)